MEKLLVEMVKEFSQDHWASKQWKNLKADLFYSCYIWPHKRKLTTSFSWSVSDPLVPSGNARKKNEEKQNSRKSLNATASSRPPLAAEALVYVHYDYTVLSPSFPFGWT